ncbi:MAG: hypothetical protein FD138_2508 [Planctomycetota bacterium]|nr:MAG: hypothetical protein FD138_2508 [Planctomycetota bacterium]
MWTASLLSRGVRENRCLETQIRPFKMQMAIPILTVFAALRTVTSCLTDLRTRPRRSGVLSFVVCLFVVASLLPNSILNAADDAALAPLAINTTRRGE